MCSEFFSLEERENIGLVRSRKARLLRPPRVSDDAPIKMQRRVNEERNGSIAIR
jgi:hypothetical protein